MANPWTFQQLAGPRKKLVLAGWSAPFGRARQKAVVRDAVRIRQKTTRYPGSDGAPTRHVFGDAYEPWELRGRFMDREGGPGYAIAKTKEVLDFVRDKQEVKIDWGDTLSVNGFLESFEPGRESTTDVEWKLVVLVDEDNFASVQGTSPAAPKPSDRMAAIQKALGTTLSLPSVPSLRPSLLDALANAVATVNSALALPMAAVAQITNLEQATMSDLQRLRAGLGQLRTAVLSLRDLAFSTQNDTLTLARSLTGDAQAGGLFAAIDVQTMAALAETARLDRAAAIAEQGQSLSSTIAKAGDTWESLSIRAYGSPDNADAIRQANGVRYGQQPVAGQRYVVPYAT